MKDRRGFTLVEILVVVSLLAIFAVAIGITMNRNIKKQQENDTKEFNQRVQGAANLYASNSTDILTNLYEEKGYVIVKIKDLIESGLLQDNIINPSTNEAVTVEFPIINADGDYLQTKNIILEVGQSTDSVCFEGINGDGLRYVTSGGSAIAGYLVANVNIKCDASNLVGNENKIGTYELEYEYKARDGMWKRATRDVILEDTTDPVCPNPTPGSTTWIKYARRLTIKCTDNYLCKEATMTRSYINMKYATITLSDVSNNTVECPINVYSDNILPTISLTGTYDSKHESITLKGTGKDTVSGLWYYYLGTTGGLTVDTIKTSGTEFKPVKINQDFTITKVDSTYGRRTYYFYLMDEAGNLAQAPTSGSGFTVNIEDHTPPTVVLNVSTENWTKNDVTLTGSATDTYSKVENIKLIKDGSLWEQATFNPAEESVNLNETPLPQSVSEEGEHSLVLQATDSDGNVGNSATKMVRIDRSKPEVEVLRVTNEGDPTNISFSLIDAYSGVVSYCITNTNSSSGCTWTNITKTNNTGIITKANPYPGQTAYVFAKDAMGYVSDSKSLNTACMKYILKDGNSCTKKCGGGTKNQLGYDKYVTSTRCAQYDQSSGGSACNTMNCCSSTENYNCGSWSWSSCSKDCGGGTQYQYRTCSKRSAYDHTTACSGTGTETQNSGTSCNTQACETCCSRCSYTCNEKACYEVYLSNEHGWCDDGDVGITPGQALNYCAHYIYFC